MPSPPATNRRSEPRAVFGRTAVVLGLLLLASCGGGGGGGSDDGAGPTVLDGPNVVVVGDSLMDGAAIYGNLQAKVRGAGHPYTADTQTGMKTAEGIERAIAAIDGLEAGHLIIGLGTNDGPDPVAFAGEIDSLVAAAPGWEIGWVAIHHDPVMVLNEALADAEQRHGNLSVLDFGPVLAERPELRHEDGIHLTPEGYEMRADFVVEAISAAES